METFDVLKDISTRTGGDIYLGVVGPVRTGKSTFIKRFMESLVLPNIEDSHERTRTIDELPQSGSGRTVMTAEPKFIPAEAVEVHLGDPENGETDLRFRVRLVDCVGYGVEGACGFSDEDGPRMVTTPWFDEPVSFEKAAETGTEKVIQEHSTIGVVMLTDGSFGDLPAEAYRPAADRVVTELQELGKPFVIVVNSADPDGEVAQSLAEELSQQYGVAVLVLDVLHMDEEDILAVLDAALYEFPVSEISVGLPPWVEALESEHWLRQRFEHDVNAAALEVKKVRDISTMLDQLDENDLAGNVHLSSLELGTGRAAIQVDAANGLFYKVLSEYAGAPVNGEQDILPLMRQYAAAAREWAKISPAMAEVGELGYGVVNPCLDEMYLEEPELIRTGGHYGVRLRATAPSYHIIRANVQTEITPMIGTESQCEELIQYFTSEFQDNPRRLWETNVFGKSLYDLVSEGISGKLYRMPEQAREKLADTLQRIVNDTGGGIICIII